LADVANAGVTCVTGRRAGAGLKLAPTVALRCLGFVRRCSGIAGLAWVRLGEIVPAGLHCLGFVRPDRGETTATRRVPKVKIVLARGAKKPDEAALLSVQLHLFIFKRCFY